MPAVVPAFLPLAELRVLPRIHEARMRIERLEHAGNRAINETIGLDLVDVPRLDHGERGRERAIVFGEAILRLRNAAAEKAASHGRHRDRERANGDKP